MSKMMIGFIRRVNLELNPGSERFKFRTAPYTQSISSRGNRVRSKLFTHALDYEDVKSTTSIMKERGIIVVDEPFFVDDELQAKVERWVEWANHADPKEYDPFWREVDA